MSAKNKSQTSEIINLLRKQGYITSYEAIEKTEMVQGKNRYGHITNYAIYRLTKDIEEVEE